MAENKQGQKIDIKDQRDPAGTPEQEHSSEAPKTEKAEQPMSGPGAPLLKVSGGRIIEIPIQEVSAGEEIKPDRDTKSEEEKAPETHSQDDPSPKEKMEGRSNSDKGKKAAPKTEKAASTKSKTAQDKMELLTKSPFIWEI